MKKRQTLYFTAPRQVEVREEPLPVPQAGQVLAETVVSAISPGTELLVYRGQFPRDLADAHDSLSSSIQYPVAYGYSCVGRVVETGTQVDESWRDRLVFSFQAHSSHFTADVAALLPLPNALEPETACFLPNAETAINLVHDSAPLVGERVLVFGQGIVGLLTAAVLAEFPLEKLVTVDSLPRRRAASLALDVTACLDPRSSDFQAEARRLLLTGADVCLELSGVPEALDEAIRLTAFSGRIVVGSWYGAKRALLDLGGSFHRSRIRLISSQVSSIAPELSGRWDKFRRFDVAWAALQRIRPEKWITQRFPLDKAPEAYRLLDEHPAETIQVVFRY